MFSKSTTPFEHAALPVYYADELLWLHPAKAIFWPRHRMLMVADVHVGKEHVFARHGMAIPAGISERTLAALFALVRDSQAQSLTVLGDLMHAVPLASEPWLQVLSAYLDQHPALSMAVVAGNHDRPQGRERVDPRVHWHQDTTLLEPFVLCHEPCSDSRGVVLCGHLHPAWRLAVKGQRGVRAPVFWLRPEYGVLPAFGEFTGGMVIEPQRYVDRVYMVGDERVIDVSRGVR